MHESASLIGRVGSSAFRLSTTTVATSLAGSCFSTESADGPFHHGTAKACDGADARVLDRDIQSSKMIHAALLLLMLGARTTVTPFDHQPEAQHPKFLGIHKNAGRLPHPLAQSGRANRAPMSAFGGKTDMTQTRRNVRE